MCCALMSALGHDSLCVIVIRAQWDESGQLALDKIYHFTRGSGNLFQES
jgi:hypothetical protein